MLWLIALVRLFEILCVSVVSSQDIAVLAGDGDYMLDANEVRVIRFQKPQSPVSLLYYSVHHASL